MKWWFSVVLVTGCGLSESGFRGEKVRLDCERTKACVPEGPAPDCDALTAPEGSTLFECTFDVDQAQACLDAMPAAECTATGFVSPASCGQVFVDCENVGG